MQNLLIGDARRAQRLLRSGAISSVVVPLLEGQEMSKQGMSAAHKGELRIAYAARHTFSSARGSVSCVRRPLEKVGRLITRLAPLVAVFALLVAPLCSQAQTTLGTQTLSLTLQNAVNMTLSSSNVSLTHTGTTFSNYTSASSLTISYWIRTTPSTGSGNVQVQAAEFTPTGAGGPVIGSSGGPLTYTCSGATLGTNCSGTQTLSTTTQTPVVTSIPAGACTGGGGSCSSAVSNTVSTSFTLTNNPAYKTGSYSSVLTFTISAT